MGENNTLRRAEFLRKYGLLLTYAFALRGFSLIETANDRTAEEQKKEFDAGKSHCDGYEKISLHQKKRARDLAVLNASGDPDWDNLEPYKILGEFWKSLGGTWGGDWPTLRDYGHFEY